jgi:hypothetical protein
MIVHPAVSRLTVILNASINILEQGTLGSQGDNLLILG